LGTVSTRKSHPHRITGEGGFLRLVSYPRNLMQSAQSPLTLFASIRIHSPVCAHRTGRWFDVDLIGSGYATFLLWAFIYARSTLFIRLWYPLPLDVFFNQLKTSLSKRMEIICLPGESGNTCRKASRVNSSSAFRAGSALATVSQLVWLSLRWRASSNCLLVMRVIRCFMIIPPFLSTGPAKGYASDNLSTPGIDEHQNMRSHHSEVSPSMFTIPGRGRDSNTSWRLVNQIGIRKIQAMLAQVLLPFGLIPLILHKYIVYTYVFTRKGFYSPIANPSVCQSKTGGT